MWQQPRRHEQSESPLRVMNRYGPEQYAIFEEEECRPNAKRYAECRCKQRYLDVVPDQLRRECCFGLCGVQVPTLSLLFFMHALARIPEVISGKQHVHGGGIVMHRESAKRTTQNRNQHGQCKITELPSKRFRERSENS